MNYLDILELKSDKNKRRELNEASLNRIYQHTVSTGDSSFGIITAWRSSNSLAVNLQKQQELQGIIRNLGLGFVKMKGHWQECQQEGIHYDQCPPEQLQDVAEPSLFVPDITLEQILHLCNKYGQDAVIWSGAETDGQVVLVFKDGSRQDIGKFSPDTIAQAYSTVKGKNFTFEAVANSQTEMFMERLFLKDHR